MGRCVLAYDYRYQALGPQLLHEQHIPSGTYPSIPMSRTQFATISRLPSGFRDLALTGMLRMETTNIILRIATKNFWATRQPHSLNRILADELVDQGFENFEETCPGLLSPDTDRGPAFEKLLSLALLRASIDTNSRFVGAGSVFMAISGWITQLLPVAIAVFEEPERSCLLWITLTMADSWPDDLQMVITWMWQIFRWFPEVENWEAESFEHFGHRYIWIKEWSDLIARFLPQVQNVSRQ